MTTRLEDLPVVAVTRPGGDTAPFLIRLASGKDLRGRVVIEPGFYTVGAKSYGRAPTFLLAMGYEQARSVVAACCR
jgi:hypothetical protein